MTDVIGAVKAVGKILASFREIPVVCLEEGQNSNRRTRAGDGGIFADRSPTVSAGRPCRADKAGMIIVGGLNPIAALEESG